MGDVHFDDVSFGYANGIPVLDGFELHVRPGETVALVGRTGSGKSTASRLLARFYDVSDGAVRVDGHDVRDLTLPSLRHHIGMVLDEPFLFSVSIRDNIAYGRPTRRSTTCAPPPSPRAPTSSCRRCPRATTRWWGSGASPSPEVNVSGCRSRWTLLVNPPILVLDDATSAIDVQIEQQIHEALRGLMVDRTTLIIAHRLSTISLADRVAVVEGGRVIAEGTHAELLATEPRYAEILAQGDPDAAGEDVDPMDLDSVVTDDVERSRVLDADIAEMRDVDCARARGGEPAERADHSRRRTRGRSRRASRHAMAWGGGTITGGAPMGGAVGGSPGNPGNGLPFAGIPWEMRQGVEKLLADEPDQSRRPALAGVGEHVHAPHEGDRRQPAADAASAPSG